MLHIALAKLASLGLAAKAGIASAAVVAATTGAGAAGVLPQPAQDAVANVVGSVTPFEFPSSADDRAEFGGQVSTDATDPDAPGVVGEDVADDASDGRSADQGERPDDAGTQGSEGTDRVPDDADDHRPSEVPGSEDTGSQQPAELPEERRP